MKKKISIVVPVYNESENIPVFYERLLGVIDQTPLSSKYDFEIIFTDNCSLDGTFEQLRRIHRKDSRIKAFRFAKNFGYQKSILTGLQKCSGDAAIQIDVDLQDPVEMIGEFIKKWEEGFQNVYGIRRTRREGALRIAVKKAFYRTINLLSPDHLPPDAADFRLIDIKIIDELRRTEDAFPYLRGLIATMGFRQTGIHYDRSERKLGRSKMSAGNLVSLAFDGIFHHSALPLRIAYLGGMISAAACALVLLSFPAFEGKFLIFFAAATATFGFLLLGILGEYVWRIYIQIKGRTRTIIDEELGRS